MKVRWSEDAERDRDDIIQFIWIDNPAAAYRMNDTFNIAVDRLKEFPRMGRAGALSGTRELIPHASYRLVYEISDDEIIIHAVVHTARRWPPEPDEDA